MSGKAQWAAGTRILRQAGYMVQQISEPSGLHYVTISDTFRGKIGWSDRIESDLLTVTEDSELVAEIKAATFDARRTYLMREMAGLVAVEA